MTSTSYFKCTGHIAIKLAVDIHGPQRMDPNISADKPQFLLGRNMQQLSKSTVQIEIELAWHIPEELKPIMLCSFLYSPGGQAFYGPLVGLQAFIHFLISFFLFPCSTDFSPVQLHSV